MLKVWCGIIGDRIIGPYFFDQTLTAIRFLEFLINDLPILLEDVPLATRRTMFLQLDGCPAHYSINIRNHINGTVRESWIRRGSLFPWPARSPDSTFLDFHLWGRLKDIVFQNPPTTRMDMENRIRNSIRQKSRLRLYRLRKDWNNVWNITEGNLNTDGINIFSKSIIIRTTTLFKREIAYKYENV